MAKILFVDLTKGHDPRALYDKPTGGTLTSLTYIPEYLASKGHDVYVSSSYDPKGDVEVINGVSYVRPDSTIGKWDITVFNRNVLPMDFVRYCKEQGSKLIWWLHDIVDTRYLPDDAFRYVDHVVALSDYCKQTFHDFYGIDLNKFSVIPNGIDSKIFYPGTYEDRNPHLFITASALIKGYVPIGVTFDNLKRFDPDLDFRIYSSQKLHGFENSQSQQGYLEHMGSRGAHIYAPMNPKSLAVVMRKAWALLMPNSYPEICSNLLLQARACGLPVVSSQIGANPEFITDGETGLLTRRWFPHDIHSWIVEFAQQTCLLQQNKELHKKISDAAPKNVPTWEGIGDDWNRLVLQLYEKVPVLENVSNPTTNGASTGFLAI